MTPPAPSRLARLLPWRSAGVGWAVAAAFLLAGLPPFLRMPPWCDLTLYDMAARAVMTGGVHYRDIFDTNLPGFVWALVGVRRLVGPGTEAVRAVDLIIVGTTVGLLLGLARKAGATRAGVAWTAAGAAAFYPFTSEFNHCQRDVWMLLPAVAAVRLRLARRPGDRSFPRGLLEGAVWGVGVWIKPHLLFPAAAVWLLTARRVGGERADLAGNLLGGLLVGAAGVGWLVGTGTWPYFLDVFQNWNGQYLRTVWLEFGHRALVHLFYFAPWSFLHPLALVLAARTVWQPAGSRRWFVPAAGDGERRARAALAGLLIGWSAQAFVLQRSFPYAHVPETFLLLAVFAAQRWAVVPAGLGYLALTAAVGLAYDAGLAVRGPIDRAAAVCPWTLELIPRHPASVPARWRHWADCWRADLSPDAATRLSDAVALQPGDFPSVTVDEIRQVADELRRRGAADGEVLCWHDTPHAVYLALGHRPRFRFMHVSTPLLGDPTDSRSPYYRTKAELRAALPGTRYVVTDVVRLFMAAPRRIKPRTDEAGPDLLPPLTPVWSRTTFPFDQPAVFRTRTPDGRPGRYLVHELRHPVGLIEYDAASWSGVE